MGRRHLGARRLAAHRAHPADLRGERADLRLATDLQGAQARPRHGDRREACRAADAAGWAGLDPRQEAQGSTTRGKEHRLAPDLVGRDFSVDAPDRYDQGSQYTSFAFTRRLAAEGLVGNTGTVGDGLDNAMCESLIGTMKIEKLNRQPWRSVEDVRAAVFEWIETWYNRAVGTPASATSHPSSS